MIWLWTLALVAGVLLFGLLFWFYRIAVRVRWQQEDLQGQLEIWVRIFPLIWIRIPQHWMTKSAERAKQRLGPEVARAIQRRIPGLAKPKDDGQADHHASSPDRPGLPTKVLWRLFNLLEWVQLDLSLRLGTGSAASSAIVTGLLRAVLPQVAAHVYEPGRWYMQVEPNFTDLSLHVYFDGIWSFAPGQAMIALFAWWRQARARRRIRRQKARRGTRPWSIPFRG